MSNTAIEIADEIAELSPERRRLFELLLRQIAAAPPGIPRRNPDAPIPLSLSQQRFWVIHHLKPDNSILNSPAAVRLRGRLVVGALEQTLDEIIRRHESLRTTFRLVGGQPAQIINPASRLQLPPTELGGLPEAEREEGARRLAVEEAARPFDLQTGPLLRVRLLRLGESDHVVLFTMHHIIADGWSMGILIREMAALYEAYVNGRPSPLAEPRIQYADFAVWERGHLGDEALERQLDYWRRQLGGQLPQLELPADRPRPAAPLDQGATQPFTLPETLTQSLREVCRRESVTLYTLLLAAYGVLLHRYTGEADILVGSPTANRHRTETEDLIGCFINTLVMRLDLAGNPTFREMLSRAREVALDAFAHQDVPFDKVVGALRREGTRGHDSLYRVWFVLHNAPSESLSLTDLTLTNFHPGRATTPNDLTLSVTEVGARLVCTLDYRTDLFDADTVAEISQRFGTLLAHVASHPDTRLLDVPLDLEAAESTRTPPPPRAAARDSEDAFIL